MGKISLSGRGELGAGGDEEPCEKEEGLGQECHSAVLPS